MTVCRIGPDMARTVGYRAEQFTQDVVTSNRTTAKIVAIEWPRHAQHHAAHYQPPQWLVDAQERMKTRYGDMLRRLAD